MYIALACSSKLALCNTAGLLPTILDIFCIDASGAGLTAPAAGGMFTFCPTVPIVFWTAACAAGVAAAAGFICDAAIACGVEATVACACFNAEANSGFKLAAPRNCDSLISSNPRLI